MVARTEAFGEDQISRSKKIAQTQKRNSVRSQKTDAQAFKQILSKRVADQRSIHFSSHAQSRLAHRKISFTSHDLTRVEVAIDRVSQKGANDSLILLDDLAMIVNVENRTVITVIDRQNMKQNVFTNIDSAVIA